MWRVKNSAMRACVLLQEVSGWRWALGIMIDEQHGEESIADARANLEKAEQALAAFDRERGYNRPPTVIEVYEHGRHYGDSRPKEQR